MTSLSQPHDTMSVFWSWGEKRTHDTHSEWPSPESEDEAMVYLTWPMVARGASRQARSLGAIPPSGRRA